LLKKNLKQAGASNFFSEGINDFFPPFEKKRCPQRLIYL
jgi:hypothetical protein